MGETCVFRAPIEAVGGGGAFVTIPFEVEQAFGKKRVPVRATNLRRALLQPSA